MAAPDLYAIPTAAKTALDAAGITLDGRELKVYATEPRALDTRPAVWLRFDSFTRTNPDEAESQLGANDWNLTYEVVLAVDAAEPHRAQQNMLELLADVIDTFDDNPQLTAAVLDAKLTAGEQQWTDEPDMGPPLLLMVCTLEVWALSTY